MQSASIQSIKQLIEKMVTGLQQNLEATVGACVHQSHYEVSIYHLLSQILSNKNSEFNEILKKAQIDNVLLQAAIRRELSELPTGNTGKPVFFPHFY